MRTLPNWVDRPLFTRLLLPGLLLRSLRYVTLRYVTLRYVPAAARYGAVTVPSTAFPVSALCIMQLGAHSARFLRNFGWFWHLKSKKMDW